MFRAWNLPAGLSVSRFQKSTTGTLDRVTLMIPYMIFMMRYENLEEWLCGETRYGAREPQSSGSDLVHWQSALVGASESLAAYNEALQKLPTAGPNLLLRKEGNQIQLCPSLAEPIPFKVAVGSDIKSHFAADLLWNQKGQNPTPKYRDYVPSDEPCFATFENHCWTVVPGIYGEEVISTDTIDPEVMDGRR